jgi:serine phosphatase RsbU (regulator of sigma subunit)
MLKIRTKLTILPIIAVLIPLLAGVFFVRTTSRAYYEKQIGILYLTIAKEMVDDLEQSVLGRREHLGNWVEHSGVARQLKALPMPPLDPEAVRRIEAEWSSLKESDQLLHAILNDPLAEQLKRLQKINPLFAELLLTDREGRLVAATIPTTDYWQADEAWWQNAAVAKDARSGWAHNIIYDASADVQAMDVALPVYDEGGELLGVMKGSLKAREVLQQLAPDPWNAEITRDIFFRSGELFARLNPHATEKSLPGRASGQALAQLLEEQNSWKVVELVPGSHSLAACVPVGVQHGQDLAVNADETIYVVVHRDYESALAPVRKVIRELTLRGLLLVLFFAIASFVVATVWFTRPLGKLRRAALSISKHVQRQEQGRADEALGSLQQVKEALDQLQSIHTRDEMEELAGVFDHMGGRVLNFHRQLERELTRKTEEVNEDLVMAREFQEALLPGSYPRVSYPVAHRTLSLSFSHIYRPALSVSGDFFDVSELSAHCIRVLVADVMGHGARSALMTAILHALLYSSAKDDHDPARLLQRMNEEFHAIGDRANEMLFVTAIHMIIDTDRHVIHYAIAGHPSPLVVDRTTGDVTALVPSDQSTVAAGLYADTVYESAEMSIDKELSILLYTDGVTEAQNPQQEEFGIQRLIQAVGEACTPGSQCPLPEAIVEALDPFMDTAPALDDICLLSVNITEAQKK